MKPIIFGISGTTLTSLEREFFLKHNPFGFILFARNIQSREQIITLTTSLKSLFPEREVPIFIDQEGGRVARIKPPIAAKEYPTAKTFGDKYDSNPEVACKEVHDNYYELMSELVHLGITVTCAPVADLYFRGADKVIGDRSFSEDKVVVTELCRQALFGICDAGGNGVIKHILGHGRANCDSHEKLPIVTESLTELESTDFAVFQALSIPELKSYVPYAMTAHVVYSAIDPELPATLSKKVINYIRNTIKFHGKLITDDLSMKALSGSLADLARRALDAGCDIVLHCNGNMDEMIQIADAIE